MTTLSFVTMVLAQTRAMALPTDAEGSRSISPASSLRLGSRSGGFLTQKMPSLSRTITDRPRAQQ